MIPAHLLQTRYAHKKAKNIVMENPLRVGTKQKEMWMHSSARFHNSTNTKPPELSALAECCLARHLEKDYRLIRTMLQGNDMENGTLAAVKPLIDAHPVVQNACLWGGKDLQRRCRSDLRSMLMRRARYLDRSMGSCSKVVSGTDA